MNWALLKNSLLVGGATAALSVAFGFVAALGLAGTAGRLRNCGLAAAVVALALPPFLATNCWLHFLGATGVWRGWLPFDIFSLGGAIWILSLMLWPISLFMVRASWSRLEPSQLESDPAVAGWGLIRGLLAPLARTALGQAAALTFVLALNNFAVPTILQVKVFTEEIWVRFNTAFDTRGALLLSWPLVLAPVLVVVWLSRREIRWPRREGAVPAKLFRQQLGPGWFWACGIGTVLLCALSVGLPLIQIIGAKRTWVEFPGALKAGQDALWNSFFYAGAAATVVIGVALGIGEIRRPKSEGRKKPEFRITQGPGNSPSPRPSPQGEGESSSPPLNQSNPFIAFNLFNLLTWLPFLVPGVLLGIGLIAVFNRSWSSAFYQSAGIVILAYVLRYLGPGWNAVRQAIRGTDRDLADVGRLNGATKWQMLRYVYWPQIGPLAAAAWYIVFLLCLWDVESMILVAPPGGETLALRIFNLLHYGHNGQVNALCVTLLGLALAPLVIWRACCVVRVACFASTHHAPRITALALVAAGLLAGCSPSTPSYQASLKSRLFSRVQIIGTRGVGVGELNKPRSVAVDREDNLYVVDMTGRVQEFSPSAAFVRSWELPQTDKGKPKGMCRDPEGNIVVLEPHYQRVNYFSTQGELLAQWGHYGTNAGQFTLPRAVAVNSRGEAFVSEYGLLERVQKFGAREKVESRKVRAGLAKAENGEAEPREPKVLSSFGRMGSAAGEFNRPEGLCVDGQDRVYVADSCNHRIQIFSSDGRFLRAYGKAGAGKGELSYPYDICVDAAGRQYVCEFGNSRIQIFDAQDQPLEIIGRPGAEPGQFSNPWGVALDSRGNLYVADSLNHRVQKFIR